MPNRLPRSTVLGLALLAADLGAVPASAIDPEKSLDQLVHKSWTTEDGLPQNTVNDVVQTPDGYLWLATFGGLARFDGLRFTVFDVTTAPGLLSNRITTLHVDAGGVLWAGSERGYVCRRGDGGFDCLGPEDGLLRADVLSIADDGEGTVWVGTGRGAERLVGRQVHVFSEAEGGPPVADAFVFDRRGQLWAGSALGLLRWTGGRFERIQAASLPEGVRAAVTDPEGGLWIATQVSVLRWLDGEATVLFQDRPKTPVFCDVVRDRDGNLWYTAIDGVARLRPGRGDDGSRVVLGTFVRALFEDREGNLWIGTNGDGLHMLRDGIFQSYLLGTQGVSGGAVLERASGQIVLGTQCQGLYRLEEDALRAEADATSKPDLCVSALLEDRQGRLWIGDGGVEIRGGDASERPEASRFSARAVRALYEDRRGTVWIGHEGGLASYSEGRWTTYTQDELLGTLDVTYITVTRRGDLWVASRSGLTRFAGAEVSSRAARRYSVADGLPHDYVRAVYEDDDGGLWIGTYGGGMAHMDVDRDPVFVALTSENGLPENAVSSIVEDDAGNFWLSGNRGISRLRRAEAEAFVRGETDRIHASLYDEDDGMIPSETNGGFQPAAWKARDGRIYYPTLRGVAVVDPSKLRLGAPPPVAVESVRVDQRFVDFRPSVRVEPGGRSLEIHYAGLQLGLPDETRFRYRLVGHDDWVEVGGRRTAYYTRVAPGTYRFEVTAAAYAGGPWNETPATVDVVFRPFFYQTLWFQAGVVVLLVAAVGGWIHRLRRHATELGAVISELEAKNAEMERFSYTVSHDLRTPLVTIQGFTGYLLNDALSGDREKIQRDVAEIQNAGRRMSELLRDLLELSRIGRLMNTPAKVPLTEAAQGARELAKDVLAQRNVEVEIADDLPVVFADRPRLVEVFQNLFENAARFMGDQEEPRIVVGRRRDGDEAVVFVRDNGVGIEPAYHDKVFGLFERLDAKTEGTGIGLAIVKRIVEYHGGRVWVESEGVGRGSTFCFSLPEVGS